MAEATVNYLNFGHIKSAPNASTILANTLRQRGYVVLQNTGIDRLNRGVREQQLLEICTVIGRPIPHNDSDPNSLIWPIKVNNDSYNRSSYATFSEHSDAAGLHTDNSFSSDPDHFFCLYTIHKASCGGGDTLLLPMNALIEELRKTKYGRQVELTLRTLPYEFAVPSIFRENKNDCFEYNRGLVLSGDHLRFRYDSIKRSESEIGATNDDIQRMKALDYFNHLVETSKATIRFHLEDDDLIFIDNRKVLHGRSPFKDPKRHLLRVRLHEHRYQRAQP